MIDKEILDYISLDELKAIRDKWHEIENDVKSNAFDKYEITYEDDAYIDREVNGKYYQIMITTYIENDNKTATVRDIRFFDDDTEVAVASIEELESLIKTMEGSL